MVESPNPAGTVNAAAMNEDTAIKAINSSDKKPLPHLWPDGFHVLLNILNIFVGQ